MPQRPALASVFTYEFQIITRSWIYRFMALVVPGAVAAITIPIYFNPTRLWDWIAVPSTLPYLAALTSTVLLSFTGAFISADSIHRERALNTIQSLHARPVGNISFVTGKFLAIIIALGIIELVAMIVALVINNGASDLPIQWSTYLLYPLLMTVPALVFVIGLTCATTVLSGSAMLASLVSWTYIITSLMLPLTSLQNIIDLTGFHLPLIYSDIVGFGNVPVLIMQRGMFLVLGLGLTMASVVLFPRLPAVTRLRTWSSASATVFMLVGILFGSLMLTSYRAGIHTREHMRALNADYADVPAVTVTNCAIDVTHHRSSLDATATITITNTTNSPIPSYIFSLNPGLTVTSVASNGSMLTYTRDLHIVAITPSKPLAPGDEAVINIAYQGTIDEDACYTDIGEDERLLPYGFVVCDIAKRYAFVTPDYVLLTPETLWYPIAGVPYGSVFPSAQKRDFVEFNLTVTTDTGLTPLSQGTVATIQSGTTQFIPEYPLLGLSLVIGEYSPISAVVDSIEYTVWLKRSHDLFTEHFEELRGETLTEWIRNYKAGFEAPFEGSYPYRRFALVEAPVQFYAYPHLWSGEMQVVQPEMVFLPEKGYSTFDPYYGDFSVISTNANNRFPEQWSREARERNTLSRFLTYSIHQINYGNDELFRGESEGLLLNKTRASGLSYGILAPYSLFQVDLMSDSSSVVASFLERYIQYLIWGTVIVINQASSQFLADNSLEMLLDDTTKKQVSRVVQKAKADELFAILETKVGEDSLRTVIRNFIEQHRYSNISFDSLSDLFREQFNINLEIEIHDWYTRIGLPGYVVTDKHSQRIEQDDKVFHQVSFTIHNLEPSPGIVTIQGIESEKSVTGEGNWSTYTTYLDGKQSKEITMVFDDSPLVQYDFYTFLSKNIPNRISGISRTEDDIIKGTITPGERIISEQYMYEKPGEVIVDNEDPGFEIVRSHPYWRFIRSLFTSTDTTVIVPYGFGGYDVSSLPEWLYLQHDNFFGLYAKTAYMISGGHGETSVRWTADLPEDGDYDVYYYSYYFDLNEIFTDTMFERMGATDLKGIPTCGDYHFIVYGSGEPVKAVCNMPSFNTSKYPMEAHIGTFTFDKGDAVIELTNETNGVYVFADAVKWVIR